VSAIKVLFVTSEVAGLAKAGGLGEVSAAGAAMAENGRGRCDFVMVGLQPP
jgi:glycogen synthase